MTQDPGPDKYASPEEIQKAFQNIAYWSKFWKMSVAYSHYVLTTKYFVKSEKGLEGKTASDFAQEVLISLADGTRKWNTSKNPTLFDQFKSSLDSHVNNFINRKRIPEQTINEDISKIDVEESEDTKELFDYCYDTLTSLKASDNELMVFQCQAEGITKPLEIAKDLGINVKEVYNIQKQLRRKLPELHKHLRNHGN
jgi:RNA polymerase sigma factor (sigma-70 family)